MKRKALRQAAVSSLNDDDFKTASTASTRPPWVHDAQGPATDKPIESTMSPIDLGAGAMSGALRSALLRRGAAAELGPLEMQAGARGGPGPVRWATPKENLAGLADDEAAQFAVPHPAGIEDLGAMPPAASELPSAEKAAYSMLNKENAKGTSPSVIKQLWDEIWNPSSTVPPPRRR